MCKRLIVNSSGGGIAGTLDSSYYKGQGLRSGIEREYLVIEKEPTPSSKARDYKDPLVVIYER